MNISTQQVPTPTYYGSSINASISCLCSCLLPIEIVQLERLVLRQVPEGHTVQFVLEVCESFLAACESISQSGEGALTRSNHEWTLFELHHLGRNSERSDRNDIDLIPVFGLQYPRIDVQGSLGGAIDSESR